jgi:quercetin dioxygenase-like cupin family protein
MEKTAMDMKGKAVVLSEAVAYAEGAVVSRTLLDKKTGTLTLFSFDAGQALSEHTAPFDATVIILDGEARLIIGGKEMNAQTGELVIMPANVPHAVRADKRFKMLLVMIKE